MTDKKNNREKLDKKDHSGMKKAAQIAKGVVGVGVLALSLIPGFKGISNLIKKS